MVSEVTRCGQCGCSELVINNTGNGMTYLCSRCGCAWSWTTTIVPQIDINIDRGTPVDAPTAARHNAGKTEYHLVPREAVDAIAEVLNYGASKYAERNWEKGGPLKVPYNSFERHKLAWLSGEDNDPESGLPHLSHMLANLAFLVTYTRRGIGEEFRPKREASRVPAKIANAHAPQVEKP